MTTRSRILIPIIASALVVCWATASAAQDPSGPAKPDKQAPAKSEPLPPSENSWYAQAISQGRAGLNVTNFWSLGSRLRAETVVGGHKIITIVNGGHYYAFDMVAMNGVAIERAQSALDGDVPDRRPFGNEVEMMLAQGAEKVREEAIQGVMCNVYQVTDDAGRRVLWASQGEWELPVRIEIYDRRTGDRKHTDFMDWSSGIPMKEVFFDPDVNVAFERYTLSEYVTHTQRVGPVGSVPVLYADLLHGRRKK
jgi:hypothetical protein